MNPMEATENTTAMVMKMAPMVHMEDTDHMNPMVVVNMVMVPKMDRYVDY